LHCDALVPSMLGFGRQFLPPFNQKALRSSGGNLAKFTVIRRASSRVRIDATQRHVRNRGRSGSARLALETTLMTVGGAKL
jgi:hypothetical protein